MAHLSPRTDTSTDGDTEDKALGVIFFNFLKYF